jgi:hypothetical protein
MSPDPLAQRLVLFLCSCNIDWVNCSLVQIAEHRGGSESIVNIVLSYE